MSEGHLTPSELRKLAENIISSLLPSKSGVLYEKWCKEKKVHKISENVLLAMVGGKN